MRTMKDVKTCGSVKSMCHIITRPYEDKSIPHLSLYVHHMNRTKLVKERGTILRRLDEIDKQLGYENERILKLAPKLELPRRRQGRPKKGGDGGEAERGKKEEGRRKRMRLAF